MLVHTSESQRGARLLLYLQTVGMARMNPKDRGKK